MSFKIGRYEGARLDDCFEIRFSQLDDSENGDWVYQLLKEFILKHSLTKL